MAVLALGSLRITSETAMVSDLHNIFGWTRNRVYGSDVPAKARPISSLLGDVALYAPRRAQS
jgi:hypothetical protein